MQAGWNSAFAQHLPGLPAATQAVGLGLLLAQLGLEAFLLGARFMRCHRFPDASGIGWRGGCWGGNVLAQTGFADRSRLVR